ncbi:DMT family transporter [Microbispora sp. RL4-1S]|uniref:DMT family transporter n=1 Tax=Microbispora oryzae TaxID=2806554 RepID=A0A940WV78_9ACTN|nr:DMT family transporter [Microbispora oryzae]MBP2707811.1 DMT family transporter [Microbispora oryzae]
MAIIDLLMLLGVAALWGASFLFMRQAVSVLGPIPMIEARVLVAGLGLLLVAVIMRRVPNFRRDLWGFLVLGALMAAVPFTLIAAAELKITASLAAILNATTPLFALLVTSVRQGTRPSRTQLSGVVLGVAGVTVLVGLGPLHLDGMLILAALASLCASLFYALGGVYAKVRFSGTHPLVTTTGQQLGAAVCLLLPTLALPPRHPVTGGIVLAVLALALACTALGFALFFHLVNRVGPTGALTVTFFVPLFGLLYGTAFLGEPLSWSTPLGMSLVLGAVFLVTERRSATRGDAAPGRSATSTGWTPDRRSSHRSGPGRRRRRRPAGAPGRRR